MKNRVGWIDSLRFLAILFIVITHYIAMFHPSAFRYWDEGRILYGVTGKLCVAFFCVLLGYFATLKFVNKVSDFGKFVVARYIRFSLNLLLINSIVILSMIVMKILKITPNSLAISNMYLSQSIFSIKILLTDSFFFTNMIVSTFWCIKDFFIGSLVVGLISWYSSKNTNKRLGLFIIALVIALWSGYVWIGICLMGGILHCIIEAKIKVFENKFLLALFIIFIFILIRNPESEITYIKYGIASCLFLILCFYIPLAQKILNHSVLSYLGKISFNIFLVHTPVHFLFTYFFAGIIANYISWGLTLIISLVVTLIIDLVVSHYMYLFIEVLLPQKLSRLKIKLKSRVVDV